MQIVDGGKIRPQKIALVINGIVGVSGGAEKVYCDLANIFCELGYDVTCLHYDIIDGMPFYKISPNVKIKNILGSKRQSIYYLVRKLFSFHKLRIFPGYSHWQRRHALFAYLLRQEFKKENYDVVISFMPMANSACLMANKGRGIPIIPCHHSTPEADFEARSKDNSFEYVRWRRKHLLNEASAIHVLLPKFVEYHADHLKEKIFVIPNYVMLNEPALPIEREDIILGVGRIVKSKNYKVFAAAWKELYKKYPNWKVRIFGEGEERAEILAMLNDTPEARERFEILSPISNIEEEYARAKIFCHPSLYEGFGLSPAEALKMGVPVVGYADCEGLNRFVKNGENGFMIDRQTGVSGLVEALEKLMTDQSLRQKLSNYAPQSISEYSRENYIKKWFEVLSFVGVK